MNVHHRIPTIGFAEREATIDNRVRTSPICEHPPSRAGSTPPPEVSPISRNYIELGFRGFKPKMDIA